jgi:hypothetical protein
MISLGFDTEPWPEGTHMCLIFNDDVERRAVIAKFMQSGIEANELVRYVVDTQTPEELKQSMREVGVTLPVVVDGNEHYCPDGTFKVGRMLDGVAELYHRSLREGYVGARSTGETSWATKGYPGSEDLPEYEARLNILLRTTPMTAICQYDARLFDGAALYDVLSVHPMMIVHGQIVRNPYYVEPEVFLAQRAGGSRL